jgi:hypothetical protein
MLQMETSGFWPRKDCGGKKTSAQVASGLTGSFGELKISGGGGRWINVLSAARFWL